MRCPSCTPMAKCKSKYQESDRTVTKVTLAIMVQTSDIMFIDLFHCVELGPCVA